jgi:hypothetical protein
LKSAFGFAVAAFCVATALPACSSSKGPANEPDAAPGATPDAATHTPSADGGKQSMDAVCPTGLQPTFDSLRTKIFSVSCGTDGDSCHSRDGSVNSAGLNLSDDPYTALLGTDGKGARANNIAGSEKNLVRVVPADPDHSFLIIKLSTRTGTDPKYGSGMPFTDPGSVCPDTLATIKQWIASGAQK